MFAAVRLGQASRLARTPVSLSLLRLRPLSRPVLGQRTLSTSLRREEPAKATPAAAKKDTTAKAKKPAAKKATAPKTTRKVAANKKPAKKAAKKVTVAKKKEVAKPKTPKIDRKLIKPPKKPLNPYMLWTTEIKYPSTGKPTGKADFIDKAKEYGAEWKTVAEDVKQSLSQRHAEAMKEYKLEYERWYNNLTPEQLKAAQALAKKKSTSARKSLLPKPIGQPSRPTPAFSFFFKETYEQNPNLHPTEVAKLAGKLWRESTPDSTKEDYRRRYLAAKEQYLKDMQRYKERFTSP